MEKTEDLNKMILVKEKFELMMERIISAYKNIVSIAKENDIEMCWEDKCCELFESQNEKSKKYFLSIPHPHIIYRNEDGTVDNRSKEESTERFGCDNDKGCDSSEEFNYYNNTQIGKDDVSEEVGYETENLDYRNYYKETQEQFKEELLKARVVFQSKLKDYGPSWRIFRPASVTDQLEIKATRIRTLEDAKISYINEGIYPEFQAIVNYGIVALIQLQLGPSQEIDLSVDEAMEYYDNIMSDTFELMCKKNVDYHESWRMMRIGSYTDFILVKLARIKQIEENCGQTTVSEGIDANYMDIVNYACFGLIKLIEQQNDKKIL